MWVKSLGWSVFGQWTIERQESSNSNYREHWRRRLCNIYERFWRHWGLAKTISGDKTLALLVDTRSQLRSTLNFKLWSLSMNHTVWSLFYHIHYIIWVKNIWFLLFSPANLSVFCFSLILVSYIWPVLFVKAVAEGCREQPLNNSAAHLKWEKNVNNYIE